MSTNSVCSEDSEASTVYHSCRGGGDSGGSGDNTSTSDPDAASFRSFSTRSISTLNSYQSALSYLSSGTGYLSALDDTLSNACLADMEEDARTLQGDEFGGQLDFDGMEPVAAAAGDQGEGSEGAEERPSSALTNGDSGCSTPVAGGSKYVSVSSSETLENKEEEEDKHDDQEDEEEEEDLTPHGSAANLIIPEDDNTPGPLATHLRVSGSVRLVRSDSCGGGGGDGDAPEDSSLHCDPTSLDNKMEEEGGGEDFSLDVGGLVRNCLEKSIISTATQIEAMPAAAEAASASLPPQQAQPPQSAESSLNCSLSPVQIPKVLNRIPMPTHFEAAQVEPPTPRHIFPELPAPSPRRSPSGGQSPRMGGDGRAVIVFRSDQHEIHDDDDQSSIGSNSNSRSGIWSRRCCGGRGGGSGLSNSQGVLVLIVVIACLVSNQVLMRSLNLQRGQDDSSGGFVNDDDDGKVHHHHQAPSSWWKLVLVRGILQCSLSALLVGVNKVMTTMRDIRSGLGRPSPTSPTSLSRPPPPPRPSPSTDLIASYCTFSLQSHRWAYFCQTILTFVFVASTVEAVDRIPASSLATVFHLIPIAIIAADVAVARKTPNFMCYISTILLIASCFMLTWPPASHSVAARHCKTSSADSEAAAAATDCHSPELNGSTAAAAAAAAAASPSSWLPPFYNADLIYGWPIDPLVLDTNKLGQEVNGDDDDDGGSGVSQVLTQVVLVVLSMACPVISVILMANRSSLDASKVVFCQGLGALAFCLIDSRRWIGLWYSDDIILAYHLAIAVLGVALNYLFVRLITSKGQKSQPSEDELSVLDDDSPELRAADAAFNNGGGGVVGRQNQDPWRHLPMRQAAGRRQQQQQRQRQRRRNLEGGGDGGSRGGDWPVPVSSSLTVLSRVSHLPTSVTLIIASQLLVFALFNFASGNAAAAAGCCSTLDILGVIGLFCLIVIVTLVGLHPHTKLSDLQFASSGGGGLGGGDDGPKTGLPEPVTSRRAAQ